jgi:sulfite exporter TauE/SafE
MEVFAGLALGFLGSLHCLGMCGPLIIALPDNSNSKLNSFFGNILYNFGRILVYTVLGGTLGLLGSSLPIAGYQQNLSLLLGIIILLVYFFKGNLQKLSKKVKFIDKFSLAFKTNFGKLIYSNGLYNKFMIGIFNGLLPCGLVYVALASSIAFADFYRGSLYMLLFGLGTLPMMFAVYMMRSMVGLKFKKKLNKIVPTAVVLLATLLILRGMALGIPYISPVMPQQLETKQELKEHGDVAPCCR